MAGSEQTYEIAGRTVTMPVVVRDASAGTAIFDVDAGVARSLIPEPFEPVETTPGRCQLVIAVIDYRDNDLGDYLEIGLTFFVRPVGGPGDDSADGTYIWKLPVNQAFTCEAGCAIWGFPKTVETITFERGADTLIATLDMDGERVLRLTIPAGGDDEMPSAPMTTYTVLDGVAHATTFTQGGTGGAIGFGEGVVLELGDHPVAKELARLGLPGPAVLTTWCEHMAATFSAPSPV